MMFTEGKIVTTCFSTFYFGILGVFSYVMFVSDTQSNGWNGAVSRFLLQKVPSVIKRHFRHLFGEKINLAWENCYDYVVNRRNPLLQLAYLIILNSAYIAWLCFGQPLLPTYLCGEIHKVGGFVGIIVCHISFIFACRVGPGVITEANVSSFSHHPYDEIIFSKGAICSTCNIVKVTILKFLNSTFRF